MGSRMGLIGSLMIFTALLMGATEAAEYTVGGSLGWRFPPNESFYSDWASTKTFYVGDKLIFNWTGTHTVADVTKADYDSCNTNASAFDSNLNETGFQVSLLQTGSRYFICTVGEHCSGGMKFSINVESPNASAPTPPPLDSSAPTLFFGVFSTILSTIVIYSFFNHIKIDDPRFCS